MSPFRIKKVYGGEDGDPGHHCDIVAVPGDGRARRFKGGNVLTQDGDKIAHDVDHRFFDAKEIRIEIAFRDTITNLAFHPGVDLVFGHRFEDRAVLVRRGLFQILGHIDDAVAMETLYTLSQGHLKWKPGPSTCTSGQQYRWCSSGSSVAASGESRVVARPRRWARPKLVFTACSFWFTT